MAYPIETFASAPFEIIDGDRGKAYPKQNEFRPIGHCLFLSAKNVTRKGFNFSSCLFVDEQKDAELRKGKLQREDVVLTTRGTLGNVAHYSSRVPFEHVRINSGMVILRCDQSRILPRYLYAYLRSELFQAHVGRMRSGVAQPQLPIRDMKWIEFPLPSPPQQERLVNIIVAYDDMIENNRRRIALLEEAARLLYREWFVHFRFPGYERVKITDGLPEGWERRTLGSVLNLQRGFDLPVSSRVPGGVPVYGSTGIVGEHNVAKVTFPTLVTGRSGSLGKVCIVEDPCWPLNTSLWVTEFRKVPIYYAYFMLSEMSLGQFNAGASVPTLDRKVAHAAYVLVPPRDIAALFNEQMEVLFRQKKLLDQQALKLTQARELLLPRLMNGEIAV